MHGRTAVNGGGTNGRSTASTISIGRAFAAPRPSSSSNSPERKTRTIRRSQSATMTMNSLAQFREMTIRPVKHDSDEDDMVSRSSRRSSPSTPPKTPNMYDISRTEPRTSQVPLPPNRSISYPTNPASVARHHSVDRALDFRRGRATPHSPSSSTDDREVSPARTVASTLTEISTNTGSFGNFSSRSRAYPQSGSPAASSPSSPLPPALSPPIPSTSSPVMNGPGSSGIYLNNGPMHRASSSKSTKLYKSRTLRNQGSNSTLTSIRTTDSMSNLRSPPGDASKVLGLMKELRGKMEGILEYRIGDGMTWTKGHCTILDETGRLVHFREDKAVTVIGDLRGCQIRTSGSRSDEYEGIIEVSTFSSRQDVKLRPLNAHQYDCWLAALLCWQPIRPAGPNNKMVKTQAVKLANDRKVDRRRNSDATVLKEAAIIKVGKMMMWDRNGTGSILPATSSGGTLKSSRGKTNAPAWRKISCILQENGEFKLYNEADVALLHVLQLSSLSRSAIQYLDPSVLGQEYCIGLYPHYSPHARYQAGNIPIYLATDSRILFEVWFVLLRAYTVPELYGPVGLSTTTQANTPQTPVSNDGFDFGLTGLADAFRVPRQLNMRVIEAKLPGLQNNYEDHRHQFGHERKDIELFFEVVVDGDVRARTMPRVKNSSCIWMEQFEFNELPSQLNAVEMVLKQRTVKHKRDRGPTSSNGSLTKYTNLTGDSIGVVIINLNDLEYDTETEVWWPIHPISRNTEVMLGEVMLKLRKEELVVLMMEEYKPLLELLQNFPNGLTIQIGQVVSSDLRRLAHTLLKIFQVSGKAVEWLMALTEAEIAGLYKENAIVKYNFPIPGVSTDMDLQLSLTDQPENAPKMDPAKRALMEANILFRGNSLLTKAVEAHMTRFGKEYMDETIGEHVKRIAEEDIHCEVDPMKCKSSDDLRHSWKLLNSLVRAVWKSIYVSTAKCPVEVRRVLYHVRLCAEEKYGNVLEGVSYSSVSGFLFLRFFCPAVLNPKLFGILKDHPGTHAQRTLTLIAKSLQGLANMTTFGVKEPWFEPMNEFLVDHTTEFREFIDSVSAVAPTPFQSIQVPASYATPITIQSRLQQASKEGFPSLPFLIDQPRAIGRLVQMWLKWHEHQQIRGDVSLSGDLLRFHELCLHLKDRMTTCVERAENAERPGSSLSNRWEAVAESVASSPAPWESRESIGIGYTTNSNTPTPSAHKGYSPSISSDRHPYSSKTTTVEEEMEYAGVAAIGKNKLTDFVGGLKRKVKKEKEEWKEDREREKEKDRENYRERDSYRSRDKERERTRER